MQVTCPWCRCSVPLDAGPPAADCPKCGRPLAPSRPPTVHGPRPEHGTVTEHHPAPPPDEPLPRAVGRYTVLSRVGSGGFGSVYRGYDEELYRDVAIKVPHRHRLATPEDVAAYRDEARTLARLDHPGIVPVYDVGQTDAGAWFLVSKFIAGTDLAGRLREGPIEPAAAAGLVTRVADALHHAHEKGLVHRDVKPANILLDEQGRPYVTDFGLALKEEDFASGPTFAGTPMYMSPEQARSEGHRVDRRTDVYSLGVVFYEMLAGRPPFQGETTAELLDQITGREPEPPHFRHELVPPELERVCLKALSKRASDRYATAREMADDLDHWLGQAEEERNAFRPPVDRTPLRAVEDVRVVPRGLRPFDDRDSEFFLELLPGPRDRDGLPASIRFWKTRLEATDAAVASPVNLVYGPSGCGKSSLVRAGLLPRLASHVAPLYVEAARDGTERRLLGGLWNLFPGLTGEVDLPTIMTALRRGRASETADDRTQLSAGRKLVIILDQFEQFLHGIGDRLASSPLVAAMRQADGVRVQFLLSMREDFWLAGQRLFQELEVPLVEGRNMELIDLFDPRHARHVLTLFGQAHKRLPARSAEMTPEQNDFLDQAVAGLSEEGKIIPVRLSLFAEMMKSKSWTPASLHEMGGPAGVGLAFLQDNFPSGPQARRRPDRKALEKPARGVLAALLPEPGSDIKGRIRSADELQKAAAIPPHRFDRLLELLDRELRIITPTEPPNGTEYSVLSTQYYQLTHDFLVPPLREWLTQRQRETWRGRAELCLQERAAQWNRSPEDRFLPTPLEYLGIVFTVRPTRRTPEEHGVMKRATVLYGRAAAVIVLVLGLLGWWWFESSGRNQARAVTIAVENAGTQELPRLLDENLPRLRRWADAQLRTIADDPIKPRSHRLRANLALVEVDPHRAEGLCREMLTCPTDECRLIRDRLAGRGVELAPFFRTVLHDPERPRAERFRAGLALALFDKDGSPWTDDATRLIVDQLLASGRDEQRELRDMLRPIAEQLMPPLLERYRDVKARPPVRIAAADALADYALGDRPLLEQLAREGDPDQRDVINAALTRTTLRP